MNKIIEGVVRGRTIELLDDPGVGEGQKVQVMLSDTSIAQCCMVPFGAASLVFSGPPPAWFNSLLTEIGQIGELKENWDSYGARPIDPRCAEATTNLLLSVLDSGTPRPFVVPTSRGGIQVEWHRAGVDLEIEIESPARVNVFFEDHREGTVKEITLTDDLQPLKRLLERLGED